MLHTLPRGTASLSLVLAGMGIKIRARTIPSPQNLPGQILHSIGPNYEPDKVPSHHH